MSRNKEPSQRQLRVGEQLRHIVSDTLRRGHFHAAGGINVTDLSVTEVTTSPDLKQATAYMISLTDRDMTQVIKALNNESSIFQKAINTQTNLKFTPRIKFESDQAYDEGKKIDQILSEINRS